MDERRRGVLDSAARLDLAAIDGSWGCQVVAVEEIVHVSKSALLPTHSAPPQGSS